MGTMENQKLRFSFEFFPPRSESMARRLTGTVERLKALQPAFMTVTYGAGGSTREKTLETAARIQRQSGIDAAAHLTCIDASRGTIHEVAAAYAKAGIRHIVALRGDPPEGQTGYTPHPEGYAYASDLVAGLSLTGAFEVSVAAYPEVHPESRDPQSDLDNLKRKLEAGATRAISQFFFDSDAFLRFVDRARAAGIDAPIIAGILPISNFTRTVEFAQRCGAAVPEWMFETFAKLAHEPETGELVAASVATEQCRYLQARGVRDFHFYTLNRYQLTSAICRMLEVPASHRRGTPSNHYGCMAAAV